MSHYDCTGNPVDKDTHLKQNAQCRELIASWQLPIRILGLWVNDQWPVEILHDSDAA